jgi:hypothetical protein
MGAKDIFIVVKLVGGARFGAASGTSGVGAAVVGSALLLSAGWEQATKRARTGKQA